MRRAGDVYPKLCALYGRRRDVTEFTAGQVLRELSCMTDEQRLQDLSSYHMSKGNR